MAWFVIAVSEFLEELEEEELEEEEELLLWATYPAVPTAAAPTAATPAIAIFFAGCRTPWFVSSTVGVAVAVLFAIAAPELPEDLEEEELEEEEEVLLWAT